MGHAPNNCPEEKAKKRWMMKQIDKTGQDKGGSGGRRKGPPGGGGHGGGSGDRRGSPYPGRGGGSGGPGEEVVGVTAVHVDLGGQDDDDGIAVTGGVSRGKEDSFNLTTHASKGEEKISHEEGSLGKVRFADQLGLPLCYEPGAKYSPDYDITTFLVWHDGAMERLSAWDPVGTHTGVDVWREGVRGAWQTLLSDELERTSLGQMG
uniref:Uncharacterized protein n=1 Tax=Chromera velia CCMP2878 TaxID=1169474 RepID=A0A0G4FTG8_9ALVE|eukprot:Cvel_18696.t1-p1 / transcript=Cvel_18696.t1 / gene=Cvel_18696 / organism=Chromera_velia_CCMP2878 / gene_product=hypothetical protein / transcript_product=hypothetical protein / location=Cvel_scaffold1566:11748-12472(+) / protein_length=205 / sequence_SO=supercontig / SO=protein_coding / is_pseudo=false